MKVTDDTGSPEWLRSWVMVFFIVTDLGGFYFLYNKLANEGDNELVRGELHIVKRKGELPCLCYCSGY